MLKLLGNYDIDPYRLILKKQTEFRPTTRLAGNGTDGRRREGAPAPQSPSLLFPLPRVQGRQVRRAHAAVRPQPPQGAARFRAGK